MNKRLLMLAMLLVAAAHAQAQAPAQAQAQTQNQGSTPLTPATDASLTSRWQSLWRNANQRAYALQQTGHAAEAAALYTDPRSKAYAQIQAGDYANAASALKPLNDSEAHYNRGNALAQAGDLQGALDAYDAALKADPKHADARHNRDLVAKALQQQKDAAKQQGQQQPQDGKDAKDSQGGAQQGHQGAKQDGQQGTPQDKPEGKPGDKPSDKAGDKSGSGQSATNDGKSGSKPDAKPDPAQTGNKGDSSKLGDPGQPQPATPNQPANDAEQARRDAQASLQPNAKNAAVNAVANGADAGAKAQATATPLTEKQMAQEQWLRSIPDDPGGLLRRKFLIQHMMRQRDAQP
jgi:Ca-activated chloride channel family protein